MDAPAHGRQRRESVSRETLEAARRGDEAAWVTIFDLGYPRLHRFFRARLSSAEQAEDLASNVLLEGFRSIDRFEWQGKPFEAWLFGIAGHQLASFYRLAQPTSQLVETAVRDELVTVEIRDTLERLPAHYREALELRFMVGLSGVEAAEVMGRSHGSFRSLLLRASQAFRREHAWADQDGRSSRRCAAAGLSNRRTRPRPQSDRPPPRIRRQRRYVHGRPNAPAELQQRASTRAADRPTNSTTAFTRTLRGVHHCPVLSLDRVKSVLDSRCIHAWAPRPSPAPTASLSSAWRPSQP